MLKYHNFQLPYFPVLYSPAIPHKLLVMGDPIAGKHAGGIFNTLPAVLIRAISKRSGGVEVRNVLWMDKYCRDLICYPLEASCTLSAWKKRERETEPIITKYEI